MSWPPYGNPPYEDGIDVVASAIINDIIDKINDHLADSGNVHGITDTADLQLISTLTEAVQDIVGEMFIGSGLTAVYNDATGKVTLTVTASGATGPQGQAGVTGPPGSSGPAGRQGFTGAQGLTGPQGFTGVTGSTGTQGATGPIGASGAVGASGSAGSPGGATGTQGATGPIGSTGVTGATGAAGAAGATGSQGFTGVVGSSGPPGANGDGSLVTTIDTATLTLGPSAGTGATATVNTKISASTGFVEFTAGSSPATLDLLFKIEYDADFDGPGIVLFQPVNGFACEYTWNCSTTPPRITFTYDAGEFEVYAQSAFTPLEEAVTYSWAYHVIPLGGV